MKYSVKVAFSGMMAALSVVVLFLAGMIPSLTIAVPAVAGCLLIPVAAELGGAWSLGVYLVCGVLAFLLVPDREVALIYLLFFGYYPILAPLFERIRIPALRWGAKLLLFNAAAALEVLLAMFVLGIPWEEDLPLGMAGPVVLLLLANVVFVVFDIALKGLVALYFQRLHGRVRKLLKLK